MDRPVIIFEGLEHEPSAGFLRNELVGSGSDRFLQKRFSADLPIIVGGDDPASAAHIGGSQQDRKIEKRRGEFEPDRALVHRRQGLRLLMKQFGGSAGVVLVAPLDVLAGDRRTVVKLDAVAQPERRALRVIWELEMLCERQMIVFPVAEVLD